MANLKCQLRAALCHREAGRRRRPGSPGDALVTCPAEGDSSGDAGDLSAGPVSLLTGIKVENILPLMASDSRLNCSEVLRERVVMAARGGTAQQVPQTQERAEGKLNFKCVHKMFLCKWATSLFAISLHHRPVLLKFGCGNREIWSSHQPKADSCFLVVASFFFLLCWCNNLL